MNLTSVKTQETTCQHGRKTKKESIKIYVQAGEDVVVEVLVENGGTVENSDVFVLVDVDELSWELVVELFVNGVFVLEDIEVLVDNVFIDGVVWNVVLDGLSEVIWVVVVALTDWVVVSYFFVVWTVGFEDPPFVEP